jgi:phosphoenolpyruvate---glycerone phosphotransferase subunit DhaL
MTIDVEKLQGLFTALSETMTQQKEHLCELDGVIGDADHGIAMELGFVAAAKAVAALDAKEAEPSTVFNTAAKAFLNAVGASSGPLYATAFMRAGAAVKGKASLSDGDMQATFVAMAKGIQDRGKAERGEKTMIDAWLPAAEAVERAMNNGDALPASLAAAAEAASLGAEKTKDMIAAKGRSSRLGDRSLGHIDPGAASAAIMIDSMHRFFADT